MQISSINIKDAFFIILLVLLGGVMLRIFSPFLDVLVVALIVVQLFYPIYKLLHKFIRNKGISSAISTILVYLFVFLPLFAITLLVTAEILNLVQQFAPEGSAGSSDLLLRLEEMLRPTVQEVNKILTQLKDAGITESSEIDIQQIARDAVNGLKDIVVPLTTGLISGTVSVLFYIFLLTLSIIYLFIDFDKLPNFLSRFSPLDDKIDKLLITKFMETSRAVIIGNFFVAMAQATAVLIPMLLMQIGAPALLWIIMVILSLVPVGSGLIFVPLGILLALSGRAAEGLFLIVYGGIIINVVDATLRPRLMKGAVQLHPLIVILSVIGGIAGFGPLGLIYGPLIAVFFTSLMEVYNQQFLKYGKAPEAVLAEQS